MNKVAVIGANFNGFDNTHEHVKQSVPYDLHFFTEKNFPLRANAMTPRLQARIPKMMAWQMRPGYDYYIWVDSSCILGHPDSIKWFLEQLGDADMAAFLHPHRKTVQEEADYLRERLELERTGKKQKYILPRYEHERLDDQMAVVNPEGQLYATTALIYRNSPSAQKLMDVWWLNASLYHTNEQLSLDTAITQSGAKVNPIPINYLKCDYLTFVREHGHQDSTLRRQ